MALQLVSNVSSLNAQSNLSHTTSALSTALERLSSGLKINRGADNPAGLVISDEQQAQINGLNAAIDNTNQAISTVQIGEGALNEVDNLLLKIRGLAVTSSNTGTNDASSLAANQAEIANALATINQITGNTQIGSRFLFNGSSGLNGTTTSANATFLKASSTSPIGLSAINVTTAGARASAVGANAVGTLAQAEHLTINGVTITLASGDTIVNVVNKINNFQTQTGVTAENDGTGKLELYSANFGSAAKFTVQSDVAAGANTTGIGTSTITATGVDAAGTIGGVSAIGVGNVLTAQGISVQIATDPASLNVSTYSGAQGSVNIVDQSLNFQIGAEAGQTTKVAFNKTDTSSLGIGANGSSTANLAAIDVRSFAGAQDAIRVVDQAISDVDGQRATLGAFQGDTLASIQNNLQTSVQNETASEGVIRNTDYAQEISTFTQLQVQEQAGTSVLSNANQLSSLVLSLLQKA
jgi:flagellin